MKISFISKNDGKIKEVKDILDDSEIEIIPAKLSIDEIQTDDVYKIVRDKVLKAFKIIGKPVFVEHTGLYIHELNGFPGGLTQIFWDTLDADKFAQLISKLDSPSLTAKTVVGFCDGKKLCFFEGQIDGAVPESPRGSRDFQWDCVFIPEGFNQTFAEMGDQKNEISMRRLALENFRKHLKGL